MSSNKELILNYTNKDKQKTPFITVSSDKTDGWYASQQLDYNFMAGSIKVNFTSSINKDDFFIYNDEDENDWSRVVDFFSSFNSLQQNLMNYLYTSTIVNIIFQDFMNQLYSNSDQINVLQTLNQDNESFLDKINENVITYTKQISKKICDLQQDNKNTPLPLDNPAVNTLKNDLNNIFGIDLNDPNLPSKPNNLTVYDLNWKKSTQQSTVPLLIHAPICNYNSSDGTYNLIFTIPYEQYKTEMTNGSLVNYTTSLLSKLLKDTNISYISGYSETPGQDPGIQIEENSFLFLVYNIGQFNQNIIDALQADFTKGGIHDYTTANEFQFGNILPQPPSPPTTGQPGVNTSDEVDYIPFVVGVRYSVKITKWSPMLLVYWQIQQQKNLDISKDSCNKYLADTTTTTINDCADTINTDELQKLCTTSIDFGSHGGDYNITNIKQQLIVSDNENCDCLDARIAPYNQKNTDAGKNANLCFNTVCKDKAQLRTKFINQFLGGNDKDVCKKYCDVVAGWLKDGLNMEHANEVDADLFKNICGANFSPLRPFLNKNILISSIIISVLLIILSGFICKLRNFSLVKSNIIILCLVALFGSASFALAWEFSGQTILEGPLGGPYKNKCKSRNLNINLPMDFCPKDLGSDCEIDSDCAKTGCTANCIAQVCTPGENQERNPIIKNKKYVPVIWSIFCLIIMIIFIVIIIDYFKIRNYNINKWYKIAIFMGIVIICIIPPLIIGLKGKLVTELPSKCTPKPGPYPGFDSKSRSN